MPRRGGSPRAAREPPMPAPDAATPPADDRAAGSHRVAFEGFGADDRDLPAAFFRFADRRAPAYLPAHDPARAELLVADARRTPVVAGIVAAGRVRDTVFVGADAPPGALVRIGRPVEPALLLEALDRLLEARAAAGPRVEDGAPPPAQPRAVGGARAAHAGLDLELPLPDPRAGAAAGVDLLLADLAPPVDESAVGAAHGQGGGRPVLVVDDSPIARKFLAARLQGLGYAVRTAGSGEEALALRMPFAIVFLDVELAGPGRLDGLDACRRIREHAQAAGEAGPAVVLVTGNASPAARVRGSLAGCDGYLVKPLLEAEFVDTLIAVDPAFAARANAPRR
jgi:CheY-like chemotaxis protein